MNRIVVCLMLVLVFLTGLSGCAKPKEATGPSDSKTPAGQAITLEDVAKQEKEYLTRAKPIHDTVSELYSGFNKGSLDRQKLNDELLKIKPDMDKLQEDSKTFYDTNKLTKEQLKDPLYAGGLSNGKKLRSNINAMINAGTVGIKSLEPVQTNSAESAGDKAPGTDTAEQEETTKKTFKVVTKQPADAELKEYINKQEEKYQDSLGKLQEVLK